MNEPSPYLEVGLKCSQSVSPKRRKPGSFRKDMPSAKDCRRTMEDLEVRLHNGRMGELFLGRLVRLSDLAIINKDKRRLREHLKYLRKRDRQRALGG